MKRTIAIIATLLLMAQMFGQTLRIEAPDKAYVGTPFSVNVMVNASHCSDFAAPKMPGLKVVGTSNRTSIVNGNVSRGYGYTVVAEKEGTVTIGPASCVVGGKTITSGTKTIKIEPASAKPQQQQRRRGGWGWDDEDDEDPFLAVQRQMQQMMQQMDPYAGQAIPTPDPVDPADKNDKDLIFAKISINNTHPYKGEQVILTYKIYTRVDFRMTGGFHAPEKRGFWAENLLLDQQYIRPKEETINGKRYISYELGREALYAQQDGKLRIDVMDLPIQAVFYTSRPINLGFFTIQASQPDPQEISLKTNPLEVAVKSLPKAPADFDGAVGQFSLKGGVDHRKVRANEAITYSVTLSGKGNLTLVDAPSIEFPSVMEAYDPEFEDDIKRTATGISGSRTFKWVLIPRSEGRFTIPELKLSYFDPAEKKYKELSIPAIPVEVEKGDPKLMQNASSGDNKDLKDDINYLKTSIGKPSFENPGNEISLWFWLALVDAALITVLTIIFVKRRQEANKDIAGVRLRRATREARKRLKRAEKYLQSGDDNRFYEEIYKAIWGCLADKFNIELSRLSGDTVQSCLAEKEVPEEKQQLIKDTLQDVDYARFAPGDSSSKKQSIYEKALDMIRTLSFVLLFALLVPALSARELPDTTAGDSVVATVAPSDYSASMTSAEALYRAAHYQEALALYESMLNYGYASQPLYYNAACAYYRTARYPEAILYYERALRLKPSDREARENLALANSKVVQTIEPLPPTLGQRCDQVLVLRHTTAFWLVWILLVWVVLMAAGALFALSGSYSLRKWMFGVMVAAVVALLPLSYIAVRSHNHYAHHNEAIVIRTVASVQGSPDAGSVERFQLHGGAKVSVLEEIDGWLEVRAADGNRGWMSVEDIERI